MNQHTSAHSRSIHYDRAPRNITITTLCTQAVTISTTQSELTDRTTLRNADYRTVHHQLVCLQPIDTVR